MGFKWVPVDSGTPVITINETSITLNTCACEHFKDIRYVQLGIDEDNRMIAFNPISADDIDKGLYDLNTLHKISIGKSYGRITNKSYIQEIAETFDLDFSKQPNYKYDGKWEKNNHWLSVQL